MGASNEGAEFSTDRVKYAHGLAAAISLPAVALGWLAMFSSVRATMPVGPELYLASFLIPTAAIGFGLYGLIQSRHEMLFSGSDLRRAGNMVMMVLGGLFILRFSIITGVPVLQHYWTASPGTITVTVSEKKEHGGRSKCSPHFNIQEFSTHWMRKNHLCPSQEFFERIPVGAQLELTGSVSPYGIKVEQMSWRGY